MREVAATTREAAARAPATNPTPGKRSRTLFFNPASGEPSVFHLFLSSLHPVIHAPFDPPIHRGSSRSLWADPHAGRNRSVPFFGRRPPALGRQQRGGFQNPLRQPVQNAQMLHTAYGAPRSDLSRETPAARALRLAGRRAGRVVRRGRGRLDRRNHALRIRYAERRLRRQSAPQQLGPTVRPLQPGRGTACSRPGKSSGTAVRPTQNASHCSKRRATPSAIASPGCSNPR